MQVGFWEVLLDEHYKLGPGKPWLQNTRLGWIIAGPISNNVGDKVNKSSCHLVANMKVQEQLEKFWMIEEIAEERKFSEEEEERCEIIFKETTRRNEEGRFIVTLPLKREESMLGGSFGIAIKRFKNVERRFARDERFKRSYCEFMEEYEALGHMTKVKEIRWPEGKKVNTLWDLNGICLLPHHGVVREASLTTKLRVVFDASATTDSGMSLNNILMVGPKLQDDLFDILLRFRKHQFVMVADIAKMYRQILIREDQRHLQSILWRSSVGKPLDIYNLNTVTYGTASASFLAVRCLQELGHINQTKYPKASRAIIKDFYMDNLLTGEDTVEKAIVLKEQISQILNSGCFVLRKWLSNDGKVILGEGEQSDMQNIEHYIADDEEKHKTLGLFWEPSWDTFHFSVNNMVNNKQISKRTNLSTISQLFNPLGLAGPVITKAKLLLQGLWKLKLEWDSMVPEEFRATWENFRDSLEQIEHVLIPRKVICSETSEVQVHGFCDASQIAYGACIYIRSTNRGGKHQVSLLCSKSRVAPLKVLSLPRLELCGALLLARLVSVSLKALDFTPNKVFYWCDSTIVLSWLAAEPVEWKTFVGNRTAEIQRLTKRYQWNHIKSCDNPADVISRGLDPNRLKDCRIWWEGPNWLNLDSKDWPIGEVLISETEKIPERKAIHQTLLGLQTLELWNKYSNFSKLQRVVGYCLRFANNCCMKGNRSKKLAEVKDILPLNIEELQRASKILVKLCQWQAFWEEIIALQGKRNIAKNSKLLSLNPFLDLEGILQVGGRLQNSNLHFNQLHPIILPNHHKFTKMLITHEHRKNLHAGPQALLAIIRLNYWPLSGLNTIKQVLRNCIVCFRVRPRGFECIMGNLPKSRVTPSRPFSNCGIDYGGPFEIKLSKIRDHKVIKVYMCAFVCRGQKWTTRAKPIFTKFRHSNCISATFC